MRGERVCPGLAGCQVGLGRLGEGRARWLSRWQVGRLGWVKGALAGFWCSSTAGGPRVRGTLSCGAKRDVGSEVRVRLLLRPRGGALIGGATRSGKQGALRGGKKLSSCKWDRPYGGGCCACACWAGTRERNGPRGEAVSWARVEEDWASWAALLLGLGFLFPILSSFLFLSPFLFQTNTN